MEWAVAEEEAAGGGGISRGGRGSIAAGAAANGLPGGAAVDSVHIRAAADGFGRRAVGDGEGKGWGICGRGAVGMENGSWLSSSMSSQTGKHNADWGGGGRGSALIQPAWGSPRQGLAPMGGRGRGRPGGGAPSGRAAVAIPNFPPGVALEDAVQKLVLVFVNLLDSDGSSAASFSFYRWYRQG